MTLAEKIKTISNKIEVNEVQYNLDKKITKIYALFSCKLDRYEYLYLTG